MSERFKNRLALTLTLTIDGTEYAVPGGAIKELRFDLSTQGFSAYLLFWIVLTSISDTDDLAEPFAANTAIEVSLSIDRAFDEGGEEATPLVLKGLVREKSLRERAFDGLSGEPILHRRYELWFEDRLAVLWGHHYPAGVYIDKSLETMLTEHLPQGVTLSSEWSGYSETRDQMAFALGASSSWAPTMRDRGASFYDLLQWLLDKENAALRYDVSADSYSIVDKKSSDGEITELPFEDFRSITTVWREPTRHLTHVLNGSTVVSTTKQEGTNDDAYSGIRRDVLLVSPLTSALSDRSTLELARYGSPSPLVRGELAQYPTVSLTPDLRVSFGEGWSSNLFVNGTTYRIERMTLDAIAEITEATDSSEEDSNIYGMIYEVEFETADDAIFQRPLYKVPRWPFMVEGTVVSEQGEEDEGTYQIYTDSDTSLEHHKVKLPLFSGDEDLVVVVPYDIGTMPGHFYFPAIRDERVEVSLIFGEARITRFLDWRAGAKLAQDTQGNHLLLGKKEKDETSIQHVYSDNLPKLTITRTSDTDIQTVTIEEGKLTIEVYEDSDES